MGAVRVIGFGRLIERMAHAHPGAADDLLMRHGGIHRPADLVGVGELQDRDLAGFVIDLDLCDGAGMGLRRIRVHLAGFRHHVALRLHEDAAAGDRLAMLEMRGKCCLEHRDRFAGAALDLDIALAVGLKIGGIHFEFFGGDFEEDGLCLLRRHDDGIADAMRTARGKSAHAMRARVGVGGIDPDGVDRDTQGLGADLRHHGLQALAEIDRGEGDHEAAGGGGVNERLRRITAEVHAGRIVDGGDAASPQDCHVTGPPG